MKKQFITPQIDFLNTLIYTQDVHISGEGGNEPERAPGRGKSPIPTSVNQVISNVADQK